MYDRLISSITAKTMLSIFGRQIQPLAKVIYSTKCAPDNYYTKIFFASHYVLVISPSEELVYFGKNEGNIGDNLPGQKSFRYLGEIYKLVAQGDQRVLRVEFGDPDNIEREMRFWDYESEIDETKIISLGLNDATGERADIVAATMNTSDIMVGN